MSSEEHAASPWTSALARFTAELTFADLPVPVISHIKLCLLDTLGCALFGSSLQWSIILRESLQNLDTAGTSAVWGTEHRLSPSNAALANGAAVHGFELDDLHREAIVHLGSVVTPAALAVVDFRPTVTGADLITALTAGYEVGARVGMSVGAAHLLQGWHPTGTHGTLAAAATTSSLLGLDTRTVQHALGIAGSQSSGLMAAQYSSMAKRFHAGRASQSGLYAGVLAGRGYTGITNLLESDYGGYWSTFSPSHDADAITKGLGSTWQALRVGFKPYSTNGSCHTTIELLRGMREHDHVRSEDVDSVLIWASSATAAHVGWPYAPDAVTTAQMNLPYIAAVVLTDGDAFVEQFSDERIHDPRLAALSHAVKVRADPKIDARGPAGRHAVRVELRTRDGRVLRGERDNARGSAADPLSEEEIRGKFRRLAATALPKKDIAQIEELIRRLEDLPNIVTLTEILSLDRTQSGGLMK